MSDEQIEVVRVRFNAPVRDQLMIIEEPGIKSGDWLIVALERGEELARASSTPELRTANRVPQETRKVVRKATEQDVERAGRMKQRATEAIATCTECITQQKLPMVLVDADYAFDGSKLTFYFTAETRVDFRKLVRDLAHIFRTRIELRQIGVRDEAKRMGGLGPCGREICCATFLRDFAPVSIRMAKDQGLNLSPVKISGLCGRLMCCLNYEEEFYRTRRHAFPRLGQKASLEGSNYTVISTNLLTDTLWLEGPDKKLVKLALDEYKDRAQPLRGGAGGERREGEHERGQRDRRDGGHERRDGGHERGRERDRNRGHGQTRPRGDSAPAAAPAEELPSVAGLTDATPPELADLEKD